MQASLKPNSSAIKNLYTQKLSKDEVKEIRVQIVENSNAFTFKSTALQMNALSVEDKFLQDYKEFQSFLKDVNYGGKPISELSQDEAKELISEDGIFGIKNTAQRVANFVISGAGGNEELLRAGREGMMEGFKMAQDMWGSELPDISLETIDMATKIVDRTMHDLGFSIFNKEV